MAFLKLKKINFIKKLTSKIKGEIPENKEVKTSSLLKTFFLHIITIYILGILLIPVSKLDGINPITQTFKDLTFSDLYYSKIRKGSDTDTASKQVIIVNIKDGNKTETRERIAKFLSKISDSNYKPKVIGLDVIFDTYSNNKIIDSSLAESLKQFNIVSICNLINQEDICYCEGSLNKFRTKEGFSNQWIEANRPLTERYFKPQFKFKNDSSIDHFALALIKEYDRELYASYLSNINSYNKQLINYRGNYNIKNSYDIDDTINLKSLKDKIVLIGLYEFDDQGRISLTEDTHWVPTSEKYFGRSAPNMYGIEIQAHIIASIINNDTIYYSKNINVFFQLIISLLIYFYILRYYLRNQTKFVFSKLFLQILPIVGFIILSVLQIHWFNFYFDYTLIAIAAFISAEAVSVVDSLVLKYLNPLINRLIKKQDEKG